MAMSKRQIIGKWVVFHGYVKFLESSHFWWDHSPLSSSGCSTLVQIGNLAGFRSSQLTKPKITASMRVQKKTSPSTFISCTPTAYWPTVYVEIFHCLCYLTIPHAALTSWGLKLANPHPGDGWSSCSQNFPSWHPGYPGRLCPKFAPRDPAPSSTAVGPLINFWISLEPMINGTKRLEMNGNGDDHQDICHLVSWTKRCPNLNTYDNYFGIQASKMEFMSCGIWELLGKILWGKFIHRFSQNLSCIEYKHHFSQNILGLRYRPCF